MDCKDSMRLQDKRKDIEQNIGMYRMRMKEIGVCGCSGAL